MITKVHFLSDGFCRQLGAFADRRTWKPVRFHAVFLALHHASKGWILIDTGYGSRFQAATNGWPQRLYRWTTPVSAGPGPAAVLNRTGIDPKAVEHIVVTHFHADHIGGLAHFPKARVYFHADALSPLQALKPFHQVRSAFLPTLVPAGFGDQAYPISDTRFLPTGDHSFREHDLFGDGTVRLVSLPGHAPGHLGLRLSLDGTDTLYATDAFWNRAQIDDCRDLFWPVLQLQWRPEAYVATVKTLRALRRSGNVRLLACHDPETYALTHSGAHR